MEVTTLEASRNPMRYARWAWNNLLSYILFFLIGNWTWIGSNKTPGRSNFTFSVLELIILGVWSLFGSNSYRLLHFSLSCLVMQLLFYNLSEFLFHCWIWLPCRRQIANPTRPTRGTLTSMTRGVRRGECLCLNIVWEISAFLFSLPSFIPEAICLQVGKI